MSDYPIEQIRSRFPGLTRRVNGHQAIFFDGPGGSQSPESVGEAVKHYLLHQNSNVGSFDPLIVLKFKHSNVQSLDH